MTHSFSPVPQDRTPARANAAAHAVQNTMTFAARSAANTFAQHHDSSPDAGADTAAYLRREAIAGQGMVGARGLLQHGFGLTTAAMAIASIGLIIGFHAWQDRTTHAHAHAADDTLVVETISDNATTMLLAGTLAKLVGMPQSALMQRMDSQVAAAPGRAAKAPVTVTATMLSPAPASSQTVWLARTVGTIAALPATLSPSRLIDPVTQAVRAQVHQGLVAIGIAGALASVSNNIDRFEYTMTRTLPDALDRATPRR